MAVVYKAKDFILDRYVAVKVMNSELSQDHEFIQRFMREAQTTGKLSHPNIVNVYDVGHEDQTYYIVMEFVEGFTLKEKIQTQGPLPAKEAISIAMQICDGLFHAHMNGIIHRDIKPQNIMCAPNGRYKVTDFGISRVITTTSQFTRTGTVMGSVQYFSPEQALGREMGYPSDLYSLGVVLYEMVTGELPFDAAENVAVALMHIQEPAPDPREKNPQLPDELCNIIHTAMAKDPNDRYQSAEEMKRALQLALFSNWQGSSYSKPGQSKPDSASIQGIKPDLAVDDKDQTPPMSKKKRGLITFVSLSSVAVVLLLSLLGYNLVNAGDPPPDDNTQVATESFTEQKPDTNNRDEINSQLDPKQDDQKTEEDTEPLKEEQKKENTAPSTAEQKEQNNQGNTPPTQEEKPTIEYIVITGSFEKKENAETRVAELKEKGIQAKIVKKTFDDGKTMYRVQAGEFATKEKAEARVEQIKKAGLDAFIVKKNNE